MLPFPGNVDAARKTAFDSEKHDDRMRDSRPASGRRRIINSYFCSAGFASPAFGAVSPFEP